MKVYSYNLHDTALLRTIVSHIVCVTTAVLLTACYSFRGGAIPDHLHSVSISPVTDRSGYGDAKLREYCNEMLVSRFRTDNTLQLVDENGDIRLTPVLIRVQDQMLNVQQADLENQRKLIVSVEVEYTDAVKHRTVWTRTFENFDVYDVANATEDRTRAARVAIDRIVDDILLAVVSDW